MELKKTNRIEIVDVLRGLAVAGIVLLHSIEHFNFYQFPPADSLLLKFSNTVIWDSLFFLLAGKAYAIFALLFGFSFYIQDSHALSKGLDFRGRFLWRLFLLLLIGQLNAAFFTAEVLVLYALVGFVLPLFARCSTRTVMIIAVIMLLQPYEIGRFLYAIFDPDYQMGKPLDSAYWKLIYQALIHGDFLETVKSNLQWGQMASLTWGLENARIFQTPALFLFGLVLGRKQLFSYSKKQLNFWLLTILISLVGFFALNGLLDLLPNYFHRKELFRPLRITISSLSNFAFMSFLVGSVISVYYTFPKMTHLLNKIIPYGRMSLTNYITQSVIGSFLFYNWGLKLQLGATYSVLIGCGILSIQYMFCRWWCKDHRHGPLEYLWKKATWIKLK